MIWIYGIGFLIAMAAFVAAVFRFQRQEKPVGMDFAAIALPLAIGIAFAWQLDRAVRGPGAPKTAASPALTASVSPALLASAPGASEASPAGPDGGAIYRSRCASCHGSTGLGLPGAIPPVAGSEVVNGPADEHVKIVLEGMRGPTEVKGKRYNGTMPPFKDVLTAEEVAAVVSYERTEFGNTGGPVTTAKVVELGGKARP